MVVINLVLPGFSRLATGETVGENLIKDLIGDPLRAAIRHINRKLLQPRGRETLESLRRKPQLTVRPQQLKAIAAARLAVHQVYLSTPGDDIGVWGLAQALHGQRQLFIVFFRAQRNALRHCFAA